MFGLRSARLQLSHRETAVEMTIFPMVHVGEQSFFDAVYEDARGHDVILYEGVSSRPTRLLTASYRWHNFDRLGMVVQPSLVGEDSNPSSARLVHADISTEEFEAQWRAMPLWLRAMLAVGAPLYGIYQRLVATRQSIAKGMSQEMLRDPNDILEEGDEFQPLRDLVETVRDAKLIECLDAELERAQPGDRVAVIYGAGHVPVLLRALSARGLVPIQTEWITIFAFD